MDKVNINRYSRQLLLPEIGWNGQLAISQAKILVVGAGGLGCAALLNLVCSGIGTIGIVDHDIIEEHNLPRQMLFDEVHIGENKALIAAEVIKNKNSDCEVVAYPKKLDVSNVNEIFINYDLVLDCTDNFPSRYLISDACALLKIPSIHGSLFRFEGQVAVLNHALTRISYRSIFQEEQSKDNINTCTDNGILGAVANIIGTIQANEAIMLISGAKTSFSPKLLWINLRDFKSYSIELSEDSKAEASCPITWSQLIAHNYEVSCANRSIEININELTEDQSKDYFIDVREDYERIELNPFSHTCFSLSEIKEKVTTLPLDKRIIVYCQSGYKSRIAVNILRNQFGIQNAYSLKNGITDLINFTKEKL